MSTFYVDIPLYSTKLRQFVDQFETWEEAVEFVKERFGGNDRGRISLITEMENEEEA